MDTKVGCHSLLQGIFPIQGSNLCLLQVSYIAGGFFTTESQRKPNNIGEGSLSLLQQIFPTQELNQDLLHCRQILYHLSYQGLTS